MEQNNLYSTLDPSPYGFHLKGFKELAKKYGFAMIILTLNNFITPYIFVFLLHFINSGFGLNLLVPDSDSYYFMLMLLNELSAYLMPVILLRALFKKELRSFIPDKSYNKLPGEAVMMFLAGMSAGAIGNIITYMINAIIDDIFGTGEIPDAFENVEPQNITQLIIFGFCIVVIAPIVEELIFRDFLLKPLRAYGDLAASIITGVLFGLYHGNFDQFAYAALLGFFYSLIAVRYNSILPTILLHAANNFLVLISSYLQGAFHNESTELFNTMGEISAYASLIVTVLMFIGAAVLIFVIYAFKKKLIVLHNHNRFVPEPHSLLDFLSVPWVILGIVAMLIVFFV